MNPDSFKANESGRMSEIELESALRHTLRSEQPPAGFAERILAEAARREQGSAISAPQRGQLIRMPGLRFAAAAALLLATSLGIQHRAQQQEQAQGQVAREKVLLALRITSSKLHRLEMRVSQLQSDDASPN